MLVYRQLKCTTHAGRQIFFRNLQIQLGQISGLICGLATEEGIENAAIGGLAWMTRRWQPAFYETID
jgi:hypothetical protein